MMSDKIRIGITHGDPNGIGYEVILKAFADPAMFDLCTPVIYGSPKVATYHRKALDLSTNFFTINSVTEASDNRLNLVPCTAEEVKIDFGQATAEAGRAALAALERAIIDWKAGNIDVIVTAPINKHSIQSDTFRFPGHTEFIEERVGNGDKALMILMNEKLRVALVTTHLPISKVPQAITRETLMEKVKIFHLSLQRDFSISMPRIAILSLNPHAGDNGLLGSEENEVIIPTIDEALKAGIQVFGPYPADGFFGTRQYEHYDGVLAMYHDQGLAPFKALAMNDGINFTAGLPLVRTSPDHGTAFDIAGKGVADETSMRQAIYTAIDVFRHRKDWDEARQSPLPKLYQDKHEDRRPLRIE
ncbi:MAG: 4-hydroxythreonine-4-phosphate dehydrogenase PdxA [Bacteroidaceae bacterium]|nr:4-hydroxythreonine-4-phosphate dehydrogenase PdxA [Bacteroidaceae bacterium]